MAKTNSHTPLSRLRRASSLKIRRIKNSFLTLNHIAKLGGKFDEVTKNEYMTRKKSALDKSGTPKRNIVIGQLGFIMSAQDKSETLTSFPIQTEEKSDIHSMGTSQTEENTPLTQRVNTLHQASKKNITPGCKKKLAPDEIKNKDTYCRKIHHSEQALVTYLESQKTITHYKQKLLEKNPNFKPHHLKGIVLDLYSTRAVCHYCKNAILGFLDNDSKFMKALSQQATTPLLRVCRIVYKKRDAKTEKTTATLLSLTNTPLIFTHHVDELPHIKSTPQHSIDDYTIFSSRKETATPLKIKKQMTEQQRLALKLERML